MSFFKKLFSGGDKGNVAGTATNGNSYQFRQYEPEIPSAEPGNGYNVKQYEPEIPPLNNNGGYMAKQYEPEIPELKNGNGYHSNTALSPDSIIPGAVDGSEEDVPVEAEEDVLMELEIVPPPDFTLDDLLKLLVECGGSDLHLPVNSPPTVRVHGDLVRMKADPLSQERMEALLHPIISVEQRSRFLDAGNLDFAYEIEGVARFRANYFIQHFGYAAVFRIIPSKIPSIDQLNLPEILKTIAMHKSGMVIVTGPTGSGKSTTLAAMIDYINDNRAAHIITIEDPLEFAHTSKKCVIDHREVGIHANSFADALRASLREDPDIILVGEMRDLETIYQAIKAAETGVLVFGTLHTNNAHKTVDRMIDVFPAKQQDQIRSMLSISLKAVVAQQLMKTVDGKGRCAANEIMISIAGLSNMIREGKTSQIPSFIETGREHGMQSLDRALIKLLKDKKISLKTAKEKANDHNIFLASGFDLSKA